MPLKDLMQNQLTAANLTAINAALAQLESSLLGKTVNLTPDERQRYGSINEQNKLLVNKTNDYRLSSPQFNAPQVDWTEFLSDFTTRATLEGFLQRLASILEQISDTKILHDNDNYQQAFLCPYIRFFYTLQSIINKCKKILYRGTLKKEISGKYEPKANSQSLYLNKNHCANSGS